MNHEITVLNTPGALALNTNKVNVFLKICLQVIKAASSITMEHTEAYDLAKKVIQGEIPLVRYKCYANEVHDTAIILIGSGREKHTKAMFAQAYAMHAVYDFLSQYKDPEGTAFTEYAIQELSEAITSLYFATTGLSNTRTLDDMCQALQIGE